MVGSSLFSRPLGGFMSKKDSSSGHQSYEEILVDDDDDYYEEVIVDDDGEEYIEEIIEEEVSSSSTSASKQRRAADDLLVTQEQVDSMSFEKAKKFLLALPTAKGPTLAPTKYADDDYEYEEIEMPDAITPIRRSRRFSLFDAPDLDIVEEESERSERSQLHSPSVSKRKELKHRLSNISEGSLEKSPGSEERRPPLAPSIDDHEENGREGSQQKISTTNEETPVNEKDEGDNSYIPEGTILVGGLNDTEEKDTMQVEMDPSGKPVSSTRSINKSSKSIQSEGTDTTMSESGSNNSLDIRQVFGSLMSDTPPASPDLSVGRKRRPDSARRASEDKEPEPSNRPSSESSLGGLKKLGNASGHSSSRRRSSGSRRGDDDDDDNRSTRSGKSRRSSSGKSVGGRRSSSSKTSEDRAQTVEAEIMELLSPEKKSKGSLDAMLSSDAKSGSSRVDSDNMSRSSNKSSRSSSRRRSSKGTSSSDKSHSSDQSSSRRGGTRISSTTKEPKSPQKRPTLQEGSKTLDDLLARLPSGPTKRSDARSTASGILRSSRGRTRDSGRDSQSVVGSSSSSSRPARARSARRTKQGHDDDVSVSSMPAMGKKVRSRSSSVGRKERLRRGRRKEETDRANRKHQEEMRSSDKSLKDERPNNSQRSTSGSHKPSSSSSRSRSRSGSFEDELIEPESRSQRGSSSRNHHAEDDSLRSPGHHRQGSSGRPRSSDGRRPRSSDGRRPRSSTDRSTSSKAGHDEPRSARKTEGDDNSFDELDGNASFSRTLNLARSLHDVADDEHDSPPRTPTHRKSVMRSSSGGSKSPGDSQTRRSPGKTKSADDLLLNEQGDDGDARHHSSRLSSAASAMRDSGHRTPKTPKDRRREPLKKKHSSDDVLLVPELATDIVDYEVDGPRTPGGSKTRNPPSRAHSSRNSASSGDKHETRHSYHSPRKSAKSPATTSRPPPPRSQSETSPRPDSPTKLSQMRQASRTSDFKSPGQSSSFSSPSTRRRKSMDISPTKSPGRGDSMDMSSSAVSGPPLTQGAVLTPFERLSELEKIKTFLTNDEYERKKKEILACI